MNKEETIKEQLREIARDYYNKNKLIDLANNIFKIPMDKKRLEDYAVSSIKPDALEISIIDTKNNTTYFSCLSSNLNLLNYFNLGGAIKYVYQTITHKGQKICRNYKINDDKAFIEKLEIKKDDKSLVIEKSKPYNISLSCNCDGEKAKVELKELSRVGNYESTYSENYKDNYNESECLHIFESKKIQYTNNSIEPYEYCLNINDSIVSGIITRNKIYGACLEQVSEESIGAAFSSLFEKPNCNINSFLTIPNLRSLALYYGYASNDKQSYYYEINILKQNKTLSGAMTVLDNNTKKPIEFKEFHITSLTEGKITSEEVDLIIMNLQSIFKNIEFIDLVIIQLETFKEKLEFRKGNANIIDEISAKNIKDKSLEEIDYLISQDPLKYFQLIEARKTNLINKYEPHNGLNLTYK